MALIPKVTGVKRIEDFRPITLANASYKIVGKVLAIRIRGVIGDLTHESQPAFVIGRSIQDSIALAEKVILYVRGEREEKMDIKIDFRRAFDTLN